MKARELIVLVALLSVSFWCSAQANDAGRIAQDAFFAIEAQPFSSDVVKNAANDIKHAYRSAPTHPWVLIAISRLFLEQGYQRGDRSRLSSYGADAVTAANDYARRAVEHGPRESMAHVQLARLQIITENHKGAWETLNRAHALDPNGFYPWYYRAVISLKMNDIKRAADALNEAESRAAKPFQKGWAVGRQLDVARLLKDVAREEHYYKQLIEMAPAEPHPYGNYALFLKKRKRYDEAIEYYKKAVAISPYPLAVEQLKQTILLRDAAQR